MITSDWLSGNRSSQVWHVALPVEWTWVQWYDAMTSACEYMLNFDSYVPLLLITSELPELITPASSNKEYVAIANRNNGPHHGKLPDNVKMYGRTIAINRAPKVPDYITKEYDYIMGCDTMMVVSSSPSVSNVIKTMTMGYVEYDNFMDVDSNDVAFDILNRDLEIEANQCDIHSILTLRQSETLVAYAT